MQCYDDCAEVQSRRGKMDVGMMDKTENYTDAKRTAWNASAAAFEQTDFWQDMVAQLRTPGFSAFDDTMSATLREIGVEGRRAVQIACNNGRELLSLPTFGAVPGLGIDISDDFLTQARKLAEIAGLDCEFLRADIYDLPTDVPRGFDLGLITIGVVNWMPDISGFFRAVASLLAQDAVLVIYETHPVLEMFDPESDDPYTPDESYFRKEPHVEEETIAYLGAESTKGPPLYWFVHTMGDIINACIAAGLTIERLTEHAHSNREELYDKYEGQDAQLPMCFTLVARKTG